MRPVQQGKPHRGGRVLVGVLVAVGLVYGGAHVLSSSNSSAAAGVPYSSTGSTSSGDGSSPSGSSTGESTGQTSDPAQAQAAALDQLLNDNAGTRGQVTAAVSAVDNCDGTTDLSSAVGALQAAAATRQSILDKLANLDVSGLPGGAAVVQDLHDALTWSISADQAFASWAQAMENGGCGQSGPQHTSDWDTGSSDSQSATSAKQSFVAAWNPIALQYGLTSRSADDV